MLKASQSNKPVEAVLRVDMLIAGEECEAGEVVELKEREYRYLFTHDRVLEATKENVERVRAEVAARKKIAANQAAKADELADTKNQLATALARIAELEKGKK